MPNDPLALSYPSMVVTSPELDEGVEVEGVSKSKMAEEMASELMQSARLEDELDITQLAVDTTTAEEPQEVREQYGPEDSEESCEDDEAKRVMELASRAASVPAIPVIPHSEKYIGLVAERKIISLENKLMQAESELRQALKDLARYRPKLGSPRRTGISVATQTSTCPQLFVDPKAKKSLSQRAQPQGSPLLPASDYATFKKFIRGICYRFLPGTDPQELLQKWFGSESDAVRHFQATYLLTPTMVTDLCKHVSPVVTSKRSTSASPVVSHRGGTATGPSRRRSSVPRSTTREESPSRKKVTKKASTPKLKVAHGSTVTVTGAPAHSSRGTYLGKDDRGLACVQMFGFREITRIHPKDIKVEKRTRSKGTLIDVFSLNNKIPIVPGDEVILTSEPHKGNPGLVLKVTGDVYHLEVEVPRIIPNNTLGNNKRWGSVDAAADPPAHVTPRSTLVELDVSGDEIFVSRFMANGSGPPPCDLDY